MKNSSLVQLDLSHLSSFQFSLLLGSLKYTMAMPSIEANYVMMTWCIRNYCDAATLIKGAIHQASLDAALRFHSWAGVALVSL